MSDYRQASPEVIASIELAAHDAGRILNEAGLRTLRSPQRGVDAGVEIELDMGDHPGQGVYLSWYPGSRIVDTAIAAMRAGHLDDPSIAEQGRIREAKLAEITMVLRTHGLRVEDVADDLRPFTIRVPHGQSAS